MSWENFMPTKLTITDRPRKTQFWKMVGRFTTLLSLRLFVMISVFVVNRNVHYLSVHETFSYPQETTNQ